MNRITKAIETVTNSFLVVFVVVLVASTTLQVVSRFILKSPIIWTEEITRFCFIWMALLGATLATRYKEHLGLDFTSSGENNKLKASLKVLVHFAMTASVVVFTAAGWFFVERNFGRTSVTTGMPMVYLYISAPVSGVIMLYYLLEQIPSVLREWKK